MDKKYQTLIIHFLPSLISNGSPPALFAHNFVRVVECVVECAPLITHLYSHTTLIASF